MKILFTTHYHAFQNPGGGETVLLNTKKALEAKGLQVKLFNQWEDKISKFDIIHDFSSLNWRNWEGFKAYGPKLIVTPVMWPNDSFQNKIKENFKYTIKELTQNNSPEVNFHSALKIPDAFFCTSSIEAKKISNLYNLELKKFHIIPNGIFPFSNTVSKDFLSQLKFQDYFLYVGRISPLKNVNQIIESVLAKNQNLIIVGKPDALDSGYGQNILNRYNNHPNIQFIDSLPHQSSELFSLYQSARALIVASAFETCSMVGLEAASLGTPVIMTSTGATKEYYQDFVSYVDPSNVTTLLNAIDKKWTDIEKLNLKNHILNNYDFKIIAENLLTKYEKVLKN